MMRRALYLAFLTACLSSLTAYAQGTAAVTNHCYLGGTKAITSGLLSTNYQQGIIPACTVTVYVSGTQTKATIYASASGTTLTNPFTANTAGSVDPGGWIFWAAVNTAYDVVMSGGGSNPNCTTAPNCYTSPVTIAGVYPGFQFSGGGGSVTPCGTVGQIQVANASGTGLDCDSNFTINTTTHTMTSTANMVVNALSSVPRATYDPMDTQYDGGLAAAIAGTSGYTPTQVIQAAIDYGECQIQMHATKFAWINIPLPSGITMNITGLKLWSHTSIGSALSPGGANLQHSDSSQVMISAHSSSDTITCSDGHTYTPGAVGSLLVHDIAIGGMGAVNSVNDVGIELNAFSSAANNIQGFSNAFGSAAIVSNGTSTFMSNIGYPGSQLAGCQTYNAGVLPVSDFTIGSGICGAVMDMSLDGGMANIYASDGWASHTGHPAGACYPHCAAVAITGSGTYDDNIFAQVSSVGLIDIGNSNKINTVRIDYTSREAIQFSPILSGFGVDMLSQVIIDSACTDTTLQSNYYSGIATGCYAVAQTSGNGYTLSDLQVVNNAAILAPAYVQCWIYDSNTGGSGQSNVWDIRRYQGFTANTTANNWALCGQFSGDFESGRAIFPTIAPVAATGTSVNVSGINAIKLGSQTLSSLTAGIGGQHVYVTGPGTLQQGTGQGTNNLRNLTGMNVTLAAGQVVEYVNIAGIPNSVWVMLAGPPNQTPTHVNYLGNATPSNPSLLDVFGNMQARQVSGFTLDISQLHGSGTTGQACFEQQALYPDGSSVVSPLACTSIDLATMTPGEIFASTIDPTATAVLWLATNTEPSAVQTGKYPSPTSGFWNYTVIAAGGDGTTAPAASENTTGWVISGFYFGPATAPTGSCTSGLNGVWVWSQDGKGTVCLSGTWTTKVS